MGHGILGTIKAPPQPTLLPTRPLNQSRMYIHFQVNEFDKEVCLYYFIAKKRGLVSSSRQV